MKKETKYRLLFIFALTVLLGINTSISYMLGWRPAGNVQNAVSTEIAYEDLLDYISRDDIKELAKENDGYVVINNNKPYFGIIQKEPIITLSDFDDLGRCGSAFMVTSEGMLPTGERESIGMVKPSGWNTINTKEQFDGILLKDNTFYVYNRSHLLAWSISGLNAEERNLITGTRQMNLLMTDFEDPVREYTKAGGHVNYRVTPIFEGNNLLATGVLMEAKSVETDDIEYCVFLYNVQQLENGEYINLDYKTGKLIK